jgi:hypothetical protein
VRDRVLTLGQGHADSGAEAQRAEQGYALLRQVYLGSPAQASAAVTAMWRAGVRWVVVEKFTTFAPIDLNHLFAAPYNSLISGSDAPDIATYGARLAAIGEVVHDDGEFTVYKLGRARVARATTAPPSISPSARPQIAGILRKIAEGRYRPRPDRQALFRLGVRLVTLTTGSLGAIPQLHAYGQSIRDPDAVATDITSGPWAQRCEAACPPAPNAPDLRALGPVIRDDPRFVIAVRLEPPRVRATARGRTR